MLIELIKVFVIERLVGCGCLCEDRVVAISPYGAVALAVGPRGYSGEGVGLGDAASKERVGGR